MIRNILFALSAMLIATVSSAASRKFDVVSPDGTLKASITVADEITYSISKNEDAILAPSEILICSVRTVYNLRASFKARLAIPEKQFKSIISEL